MTLDTDWQIRLTAMKQIEMLRRRGDGLVRASDRDDGFELDRERIALSNLRLSI
jgi:hypothetical protein